MHEFQPPEVGAEESLETHAAVRAVNEGETPIELRQIVIGLGSLSVDISMERMPAFAELIAARKKLHRIHTGHQDFADEYGFDLVTDPTMMSRSLRVAHERVEWLNSIIVAEHERRTKPMSHQA